MSLYECANKDFFFSLEPKRPQGYTKEEFDKILVSKLNELDNLHKEGKSGYVGYSDVFSSNLSKGWIRGCPKRILYCQK